MISTKVELFGTEDTITRPITITVTNDIKALLGITKDVYTTYDIKDNIVKSKNKLGDIQGENTIHDDIINVEYIETSEEGNELSLIPNNSDFKPIYIDTDIRSSILPVYHSRKMSIKFRYSNKSKSKVFSILNKLRLYTSNDGMYKRHELEYHYVLPNFINKLLLHINDLKNLRDTDILDLDMYVNNTFDNRVDFLNTLDANLSKTDVSIREAQLEIQGYITDDLHTLTPEYDEGTTYWSIEFNYDFIYEKPVSLIVNYPILVYNTLISKEFRTFIKNNEPNPNAYRSHRSASMMDLVKRHDLFGIRNDTYYLTIPDFDREKLPDPPNFTARMFSVMVTVDVNDLNALFSIDDIPKIKFKDSVKNLILTTEYPYIGKLHNSMFYIELYKNNKKDYNNEITMDDNGVLTSKLPLDIKSTYRVMFSVVTDLDMVTPEAKIRIKNYIKEEIALLKEEEKQELPFSIERLRDTDRDTVTSGVEQYKRESVIESYLTLLNIDNSEITNTIINTPRVEDIVFKIKEPLWSMFKTKEVMLVLTGVLDKK